MSKKRKNNTADAIKLLAKEIHELKKNGPSTAGG